MTPSVMAPASLGFIKDTLDCPMDCLRLKLHHIMNPFVPPVVTHIWKKKLSGMRKELAILKSELLGT